jgi:hypothetical protein
MFDFNNFLFKLDIIAPVISSLFCIWHVVVTKNKIIFSDYYLFVFFALQLMLNSWSAYLQFKEINNLWVYHLNCFINYLLFTFYFLHVLKKNTVVYAGLSIFFILSVIFFLNFQSYDKFPSYSYALSSFIVVIYALLFLNRFLGNEPYFPLLSLKEFWIITGVLTYFGSTFFIFISYNYLSEVAPKSVYVLWQLQNVFLSFSCIIFCKAIASKQWILK